MALGIEHPDYLLRRLTSRQLAEWQIYFREHPFGQDFSDMMLAQIASLIFNTNRAKGSNAAKPSDFLPRMKEHQSVEQIRTAIKAAIRRVNS